MMAHFARLLIGLALLPLCWGVARTFCDALVAAAGATGGFSVEAVSLIGGMAAFTLCWLALAHPVKAYVLGHELTHAIWGLCFGARPSDFHVSAEGGSVRLTKTNMLITLAPYFFPFYTFVVIIVALIVSAFWQPIPCLPLWLFLVGFTWSFHVLFTLATLAQRQPDVRLYGRVFSWALIFLVNVALVLMWLAATTPLGFARLGGFFIARVSSAYTGVALALWHGGAWLVSKCSQT